MLDPVLGYLITAGVALLLAIACLHKVREKRHFRETLVAYQILTPAWAHRLAPVLILLEAALAAGLICPPCRTGSSVAAALLLLAYATALGINLRRGRFDLDCGCGPAHARRRIAPWMVWRNVGLAAALAVAAAGWQSRALSSVDWLTIGGGLTVIVALYGAIDYLLGEVAPRSGLLRSSS